MCLLSWSVGTTCAFPGSGSSCGMIFAWPFQSLAVLEESVLMIRATVFRLIWRPPKSTTYDLSVVCCCTTAPALHFFDPGSGFTLTWSPGLSGSSSFLRTGRHTSTFAVPCFSSIWPFCLACWML